MGPLCGRDTGDKKLAARSVEFVLTNPRPQAKSSTEFSSGCKVAPAPKIKKEVPARGKAGWNHPMATP
jgi:hypothetical protein